MESNLKDLLTKINNSNLCCEKKNELKQKTIQEFYQKKAREIKIQKIKCPHYPNKKCNNFYFECCSKEYDCVRCHNENENHSFQLKSITCDKCLKTQDVQYKCINCSTLFSKSFCKICGLYSDQEHIYHCNQCEICRVGKEENIFHCNNCNICVHRENHECNLLGNIKNDYLCCFCHEDLYKSMNALQKLNCNHYAHTYCVQKSIENNSVKCGLCRKTFLNNEQSNQMWNMLDLEKKHTIMPLFLKIGEIYQSKYGLFVLEDKKNIEEEYLMQNEDNQYIVKGYFYKWRNNNKAYLNCKELLLTRKSQCNDCSNVNYNLFHVVGIKCNSCGSYNVS